MARVYGVSQWDDLRARNLAIAEAIEDFEDERERLGSDEAHARLAARIHDVLDDLDDGWDD